MEEGFEFASAANENKSTSERKMPYKCMMNYTLDTGNIIIYLLRIQYMNHVSSKKKPIFFLTKAEQCLGVLTNSEQVYPTLQLKDCS